MDRARVEAGVEGEDALWACWGEGAAEEVGTAFLGYEGLLKEASLGVASLEVAFLEVGVLACWVEVACLVRWEGT